MRRTNTQLSIMLIGAFALLPMHRGWSQGNGTFQIKNRSTFNAVEARNPFWPVGFVPGMAVAPSEQASPKALVRAEDLTLTSISIFGGTRMAMLNGKPVAEGDLIKINFGGDRKRVQVIQVADAAVIVVCEGQKLIIPLKRTAEPTGRSGSAPVLRSQEDL